MLPRRRRSVFLEPLLVAALFLLLAAAATWPLISDPAHLSPTGPNNNDARFNTYVIFWGAHALLTDPLNMHHTNMFHPERYTFAYSDIELSHSILMLPVILLFYNPVLTYNLLLIAAIVIGGTGFYLLARDLTGHRGAALIGAAIFLFNPAHFGRYTQIQLFADHWLPWFAWALLRWLKGRRWGWAVGAALFFSLHALSGSHNAVFGAVLAAAAVLFYALALGLWKEARFWKGLIIIGLVSALFLLPVFWPYFLVEGELVTQRVPDLKALKAGSAGANELLSAGSRLYRWLDGALGWPSAMFDRDPRGYLFPGGAAIALSLFGFFSLRAKRGAAPARKRWPAWALDLIALGAAWGAVVVAATGSERLFIGIFPVPAPPALAYPIAALLAVAARLAWLRAPEHLLVALARFARSRFRLNTDQLFLLLVLLLSLLAALGPDAGLYRLISEVPLLRMIRVPRRFILLAAFALAALAAFGAAALMRRISRKGFRAAVLGLVALFFAIEADFAPLQVLPSPPDPPELYSWIGEQRGNFAVVEFPINPTGYGIFARQVYYSIYHWKKLLVGYSGYQSNENRRRLRRLNDSFPGDRCLDEMRGLSVRFVIAIEERLEPGKLHELQNSKGLELVRRFGGRAVYRLRPAAAE